MTDYPTMCVEIWRYDDPDTYRFFDIEPSPVDTSKMNYHPFSTASGRRRTQAGQAAPEYATGPNYVEAHREQVGLQRAAERHRQLDADGYKPIRYQDLPAQLAYWVAHNMAPIEFHQGLDGRDPELMMRVSIWVLGELPR